MVSIMMKPAPATHGHYLVLAGLSPNDRKQLCSIRAANIQAADKALLKILSKALDGLDIDANGPADPPAPADQPAPADGGSTTPGDEPVGAEPTLTTASPDPSPDTGTGEAASSSASAEGAQ